MGLVFIPLSTVAFLSLAAALPHRRHRDADAGAQRRKLGRHLGGDREPHQHDDDVPQPARRAYLAVQRRAAEHRTCRAGWISRPTRAARIADQMITLQAVIMAYANDFMLLTVICVAVDPVRLCDRLDGLAARQQGRSRGDGVKAVSCSMPARRASSCFCSLGPRFRGDERSRELLPHLLGMLAQRRNAPYLRASSRIGAGAGYDTGPCGVSTLMRRRCGCAIKPGDVVDARERDVGGRQLFRQRVDIHRGERGRDLAVRLGAVLHALD